jgi:hypothetical protein
MGMRIYPFITAGVRRLVDDILDVLREAQDVEEGHAHVFDLMESAQETGYFASQCGWEVEWVLRPRSFSSADGDIVSRIARLVSDYEGARYVAVAYSKNTNSYYAFAYPSEHVYHFTRADIVYYHFSRDENYMLSILKEESALSQGEGSFEAIHEREFTLSLSDEEVEEVVEKEEDREWAVWLSVKLRYLIRQRPPVNCAYVVAEFSNPVAEYKAWRRVDLSSLCVEKDEDECYESLARQFLKP